MRARCLAVCFVLFICGIAVPLSATIGFDASSSATAANASSISWQHTVSGADRILIVGSIVTPQGGVLPSNMSATTATYAGQPMLLLGQALAPDGLASGGTPPASVSQNIWQTIQIWYLVNPPQGTATVSLTYPQAFPIVLGIGSSFTGVSQTSPIAVKGSSALFSGLRLTTTTANSWIVDLLGRYSGGSGGPYYMDIGSVGASESSNGAMIQLFTLPTTAPGTYDTDFMAAGLSGTSTYAFELVDTNSSPSPGVISLDSTSQMPGSGNSLSWVHTCSGTNRLLTVASVTNSNSNSPASHMPVTGITYGGQALSLGATKYTSSGSNRVELWYLLNPPSGSNTIQINYTGTVVEMVGMAASFNGVAEGSPVGASGSSAVGAGAKVTLTSSGGSIIVAAGGATGIGSGTYPVNGPMSGQIRVPGVYGTVGGLGTIATGAAGSYTASWDANTTEAAVAIEFLPAAPPAISSVSPPNNSTIAVSALTTAHLGGSLAVSGTVSDPTPQAGMGTVTCNGASATLVPASGTAPISFTCLPPITTLGPQMITIVATDAAGYSSTFVDNVTIVADMPVLSVTLTGPATVSPGTTITYNSTIHNSGQGPATTIALSATLPDGTTITPTFNPALPPGGLAAGGSAQTTFTYAVPALAPKANGETTAAYLARLTAADATPLATSISVTWQDDGNNSDGPVSQQFVSVRRVPVVNGVPSVDATVLPGSTATVSFSLQNTGSAAAPQTTVQVTNPDSSVTSSTPITVTAGQTTSTSTTWPVPSTVAKQNAEGDAAYQSRLATLDNATLNFATSLSWKDANNNAYGTTNSSASSARILPIVTVALTAPGTANAGTAISYNVTIQNVGHATATGVVLSLTLPGGATVAPTLNPPLSAGSLAPGATTSGTLNFTLPNTANGPTNAIATLVWHDANSNTYGPQSATAVTTVTVLLTVSAGSNQNVPAPQDLVLQGSAVASPTSAVVSSTWTQTSGPAAVSFSNASSPASMVRIPGPGTYGLRLTATAMNGSAQVTQSADMTIVATAGTSQPPTVNAGPNQTLQLPATSLTLNGTVTAGGAAISSISWTKVSGPGTVTFGSPSTSVTQATLSTVGTYTFRLTASDSQFTSASQLLVVVNPASTVNLAPVVNAGPAQTVTLVSAVNSLPLTPTLTPIASVNNNATGMDYHQPSGKIVMSVNYAANSGGLPFNFELLSADGSISQFSSISGLTDEVYVTAARDEGGGKSIGGFPAGTFFTGSGVGGVVTRVTPDGSSIQNPWVTLPGETGLLRGQLYIDRTGIWGGDLIVLTTTNKVWRIGADNSTHPGVPALLATVPLSGTLEGLLTVPNDALRYGPWAGKILIGGESSNGLVATVDPQGNVATFNIGIDAEHIKLVNANESYFAVGNNQTRPQPVFSIPAPELSGLAGDILIGEESTGNLWDVHWNNATGAFETTRIAQAGFFEGGTMAPAGLGTSAATSTTLTLTGTVTDDGLPVGGTLTSTWSKVSGPGSATFANANSPATTVTLGLPGTYVLQLNGNDSLLQTSSAVTITVQANSPPVVNPGTEQQSNFPAAVPLQGAVTDDGLPAGGQLSAFWTKVTGSGKVTTGSPSYSAFDDFSTTSNPNGVWSYGWESFRGGPFTAYAAPAVASPLPTYSKTGGFPLLTINNTGSPFISGTVTVPAGMLNMHPSSIGENSVVRWTAPNAGTFLVQGRFVGDDNSTTTDAAVVLNSGNSATTLFTGFVVNLSGGLPFSFVRTLNAGDYLDFTVGYGSNNNYNNDSTGLAVAITQSGSASTSATFSQPGDYLLRLVGYDGELFGSGDVRARSIAACTAQPSGMTGWWPGDGSTADLVNGNNGVAQGSLTYAAPGETGSAFNFNSNAGVQVPASTALNSPSFTLEAWVFPRDLSGQTPLLEFTGPTGPVGPNFWIGVGFNGGGFTNTTPADLFGNIRDTNGANHFIATAGGIVQLKQWNHVALTFDQPSGIATLYLNGKVEAASSLGSFTPLTSLPLYLGQRPPGSPFGGSNFNGEIDEAHTFNRALTAVEIQALYGADGAGLCKPNIARPTVSAGADQTITQPASSVSLSGTASDPNSLTLTLVWTQVSGPGTVTFANPSSAATTATLGTGSATGAYVLRLTAFDSAAASSSDLTITLNAAGTTGGNAPLPSANAGPGQNIQLPVNSVTLNGTTTNPGGGTATIAWTQVSGPGAVTFGTPSQAVTQATFPTANSADGVYVLQLSISNAQGSATSATTVVLNPQPLQPPVVTPIANQNIQLPTNTLSLAGRATDPAGAALTYVWSLISGPAAVTFGTPTQATTLATFSSTATGPYTLQFAASNTQFTSPTTFQVTVVSANTPKQTPVVNAGASQNITLPAAATLVGSAVDPAGFPLTISWVQTAGPAQAAIVSPSQAVTKVSFPTSGTYTFQLSATNGQFAANSSTNVTVTAPPPPVVSAGASQTIQWPANSLALSGSASDPAGLPLTLGWSKVSGPGSVTFTAPSQAVTSATFSTFGTYVVQLSAADSVFTSTATATITVADTPVVSAGANVGIQLPVTTATLNGSANDPAGLGLTLAWTTVSGPATVTFVSPTQAVTQVTGLTVAGSYVLKLTASNSQFSASANVTVVVAAQAATNQAPVVNADGGQTITLPTNSVTLNGSVTDDGLPAGGTLTSLWSVVSGPGTVTFANARSPVTQATFTAAGVYTLKLTANDGALTTSATTTVTVNSPVNQTPVVTVPPAQTIQLPNNTAVLNGAATDDGLPVGHSLTVTWSMVSGPGTVTFANPNAASTTATLSAPGTYSLQLLASDSQLTATGTTSVLVLPLPGPPPTVSLALPDGTEITQPTPIVATISDGSWALKYALFDSTATTQNYTTMASGVGAVSNATLATLDPTLLLNGSYQIQLSSADSVGQITTVTATVTVARNLKVGVFSLAFNDLTVPLPGFPLTVTRSYDSRDKRVGDFGVGWKLNIANVRLQKNRSLSPSWFEDMEYSVFSAQFCLSSTNAKIVTIVFPDNKVYKFQAQVTPQCQSFQAITNPTVSFAQLPGAAGTAGATLVPLDGGLAVIDGGVPGVVNMIGLDGNPYDPTQFRLTLASGISYVIDQKLGVTSVTDTNGNTLTINANGISSTAGMNIVFQRDTQGRITRITDPNGNAMTYAYTGADLTSFTDRQNNTATFSYATGDYLQGITTPNSVQVLNNAYDSSGRLLSTADAFNKSIGYTHDINDHTETVTDRLGNSTTYLYDLDGNILQTTDALGHVTSSTYDSSDQKLTDTNALGKTSYYAYDSIGNMLTQTDPLGNITSYTYNALQEPLTITDPLGHVTTNGYDAHGNLTSTKDPAGNTTTSVYDTNGNVTSMTDAVNHTTTFFYDQFGHLATQTDALGNVTTNNYDVNGNRLSQSVTRTFQNAPQTLLTQFTYDNQSRLTQTIFPDNSSTQTHYNSLGQVDVRTDELGHQTQYQYDNDGHPTTTTYSDGTTDNTTYDANGNRTQTTNRGIVTSFVYDTVSRLTQTIAAPNTPNAATTTTNYDFAGQVTSTVDALGNATSYAYDDAGRRTSVTNALNQITAFTYDTAADQLTVKDARGNVTTNTYDNDNRLIKVTYPDARFESTAYDSLGRVQSRTDANGNATTYGYDALGRLTSVTDALSQVTSYGYDEVGNRITQTDANLHTTSYQYDQRGRRTSRALPLGQSEGYTYDTGGNLHARTDFNGKTTTYGYDSLNRLLTKTPDASFSAGPITFTYTPTGKRNTMADPSGTTIYGYDNRDRLTSKATPEGSLTYNYDAANNLTVLSTAGLSVSYTYGVLNRLSTVGESNTGSTAYAYDAAGNLSSFTTPNGVSHAYTYDPRNRLTNLAVGTTTTPLASYAYTLDNAGHRTAVTELGGRAVAYGYDNIYRLTSETVSGIPGAGAVAYTYDPVGNRKQTTSTLGTINPGLFNYDANDRLSTDTYDNNGNTITSIGATSTYDFENHLTGLGPNITMLYDGDGNRVKKTVNGVTTTYLVDDLSPTGYSQVVLETTGGETRQYVYGLERLSQRRVTNSAAETRYFGYDGHGSVRLLIDTTGTVTDTYDYDAFGNLINSTGLTPNNYRFAGEQFDFDLNLYYNRARYLNPATGRFWTMDSYEGITQEPKSLHKYLYVGADPLNSVDPTGKSVSSLIYGWRVHRFVQDDFEASGPGRLANRWLSTILEGQLDLAGNWRPDLTDKVTHEVYEIKPVGSEFAGALQLAGYIILLKVQDPQKNDWKPGTTYDPPPSLKLDPLTFAVISRSGLVPGIISYEVYNLVEIVNLVAWATRVVPVVEAAEANLTIGTAALAPI